MKIEVLLKRLDALEQRVGGLEKQNGLLRLENKQLKKENINLKNRLSKFENPKNSRNSSIPPSQDENRPQRNQSLRKPSGKKPGGQLGRQGKTLEMVKNPDEVIDMVPDFCDNCGSTLKDIPLSGLKARQIVDIPLPKAVFTEYRSYAKICACGCTNRENFPNGVSAPISYGPQIESLISYFHARQYLPFARMKEMFNDVFNIKISEGGLHCLLERFSRKTDPIYKLIKERIFNSRVVGVDETGARVGGKKHWFWTWQNEKLTYIAHSQNRGYATIEREFPNGLPNSVIVRDGWRAQAATEAEHHQMCLVHLQRSLNYLNQKYRSAAWGMSFSKLLESALHLNKQDRTLEKYCIDRAKIIQELEKLLENPPDEKQKELYTFYKSMRRERQNLFNFLYIANVPPDNNGSERAVRNVKVKQKISGQFKVTKSAQNFAQIRSVIDTTIKNGLNVLESLSLIANLEPTIK